jgi:hypothetical protein
MGFKIRHSTKPGFIGFSSCILGQPLNLSRPNYNFCFFKRCGSIQLGSQIGSAGSAAPLPRQIAQPPLSQITNGELSRSVPRKTSAGRGFQSPTRNITEFAKSTSSCLSPTVGHVIPKAKLPEASKLRYRAGDPLIRFNHTWSGCYKLEESSCQNSDVLIPFP